ncbi:OmpA family protein [Thalassotalea sp. G20_0]|uniref:OmpA family protein n=1 Tax=Thalassotalea sp. G20_0 TaxID=2821093 RepID=UPI001ADC4ADE|nr:OmpA family protein [Thalassotalea sp. G20_0]MBO9496419.1 OmpA family protein [Thalassotalea sp. G20_0]
MQSAVDSTSQFVKDHAPVVTGAAVGAIAGAAACKLNGSDNVLLCAAGGALAGAALGKVWDYRQQVLAAAAEKHDINIEVKTLNTNNQRYVVSESQTTQKEDNAMSVTVQDNGMFATGSSKLNPKSKDKLLAVAQGYISENKKIQIIGHTDSSGSAELNQRLSEKRARSVAQLFIEAGIPEQDIYYQGVGESRPAVANDSSNGRQKNRRVEIVEADSEASLVAYNIARTISKDNLRFADGSKSVKSTPVDKTAAARAKAPIMDFGGKPVASANMDFYTAIGAPERSVPSIFSKTYANEDYITPIACYVDAPRVSGGIKTANGEQLNSDQYKIRDYVPGLAKSALYAKINNHTVGLSPVAVLKNSYEATSNPNISLKTPDGLEKYQTVVNTYEGKDSFLYRIFTVNKAAPVGCIDLVYPKDGGGKATAGALFYQADGTYVAEFQPVKL